MKERPILFSAPMVRAILDGRKTQTRRVVKMVTPKSRTIKDWSIEGVRIGPSPYGLIGDLLWVRETFCKSSFFEPCEVRYRADGVDPYKHDMGGFKDWNPSIFMPRWASRITLEVTGMRVERLQEIGEQDAMNEGVDWADNAGLARFTARKLYAELWDQINAKRAPWASNPWVWVIEFKRVAT